MRINAVEPGFTKTDINGNTGVQTVEEGAEIIVCMAQVGPDGPTGGYFDVQGGPPLVVQDVARRAVRTTARAILAHRVSPVIQLLYGDRYRA